MSQCKMVSPSAGCLGLGLAALLSLAGTAPAQAVRLEEKFTAGYQYRVQIRVEISGSLTPPAEKGKAAPQPLSVSGESAIDYDERVLSLDRSGQVDRTIRHFSRVDFDRKVGDMPQKTTLRKEVRRVVLMRLETAEVAFSPDGPLTWGELDLLRTDVFTPALVGLLPTREVQLGDRWTVAEGAVRELTDLEKIERGGLEARLEQYVTLQGRKHARISFVGTVQGTNEDGPNLQKLEGFLYFDLTSNHLSYLSLKGRHSLLDGQGKEVGHVDGRFVLTRQAGIRSRELDDQALRGLKLEPDADNTRLLYDNPDLGISFLHPRSWRVAAVQGRQVALDGPGGSGLLLTVDPLARTPTGAQFLEEAKGWLGKQKARIVRGSPPRTIQTSPAVEYFALEVEMPSRQKVQLEYYVSRQANGGVTLAGRLLPGAGAAVQKEIEGLARSVRVTQTIR